MAQDARTKARASDALLETVTLLLAAVTALTVIARYAADPPRSLASAPAGSARLAIAPDPVKSTADQAKEDAERQALLRDMLLHD